MRPFHRIEIVLSQETGTIPFLIYDNDLSNAVGGTEPFIMNN